MLRASAEIACDIFVLGVYLWCLYSAQKGRTFSDHLNNSNLSSFGNGSCASLLRSEFN